MYGAAQNWSAYTQFGVWFRSSVNITAAGQLAIAFYTDSLNTQAAGGQFDVYTLNGSATLSAGVWYFLSGSLTGVTRTAILGWGVQSLVSAGGLDSKIIYLDDFLLGPGAPTFSGTGPWTITQRLLDLDNTETVTLTYGSGGGTSGVTVPGTAATYTFTTASQVSANGSLANIVTSPTVAVTPASSQRIPRPSGSHSPAIY